MSGFIARLGRAGVEASRACEHYATERLKELCDVDNDGNWTPKYIEFELGGKKVKVPRLSLISPKRVDVKELRTSFKTTVQVDEDGDAKMEKHVGLLRRGIEVETKITFTGDVNVEAIELIREHLNKELSNKLSSNTEEE